MKLLKLGLIGLAVILLIAVGVIAYILNSVVSGGQKDRLIAMASKELGTKVGLDSYGLDFGSIFRLQPAVSLHGLTVANPPGFPARNMLEAQEVAANLDLRAALSKKIEVKSLVVRQPKVLIESPAQGPTNVQVLLDAIGKAEAQPAAAAAPASDGGSELTIGIGSIEMVDGTVLIATAKDPAPQEALRDLRVAISEIRKGSPSRIELSTRLAGSANSTIQIAGSTGPLADRSLPLDGKAEVTLALAEFSQALRQRFLGDLASAPGPESRASLDLALKGDLYKTLTGNGGIDFSHFLIGPNRANRLTLSGKAPLTLRVEEALSGGEAELQSSNAKLKLGSGEWAGNIRAVRKGESLSGSIDGAIRGVDINQTLSSFANSPDVLYGTATIPRFQLAFAGSNAPEIQRSLNGGGSMSVSNGRFKGLNVLATIERALGGSPTGTGEFATFNTNFTIRNQALQLSGIDVTGPGISVTGQATIGFNESVNGTLQSKLTGASANLLKAKTGGFVENVTIPVQIAGTVSNPQVRPDIGGLAKGAAKDAATKAIGDVLGGFLGRKKK